MCLTVVEMPHTLVFEKGHDIFNNNGLVVFGMSPGNPYFKPNVIEDFVLFLGQKKRKVIVLVPQQPVEHTYRALGSSDAVKRAKRNAGKLRTHCKKAITKAESCPNTELRADFVMVDWAEDVEENEAYKTSIDQIVRLYEENRHFRSDVSHATAQVLGKRFSKKVTENEARGQIDSDYENDDSVQEGVYYILKEMGFLLACKEMYSTDRMTVVYHRSFPIWEKYVNGDYDGIPKDGFGLVVIEREDELIKLVK